MLSLLDRTCGSVRIGPHTLQGVYERESKAKAHELLDRVFNQNEQALGLFFLHPDASVGITEPCVALLQVSIAVRAPEHYEKLVRARAGRLEATFQSKLGWLAGNLYSRVATIDMDKERAKALANNLLSTEAGRETSPTWLSRAQVEAAQADADLRDEGDPLAILEQLEKLPVHRPVDVAVTRVIDAVTDIFGDASGRHLRRLEARLRSDDRFKKAIRS